MKKIALASILLAITAATTACGGDTKPESVPTPGGTAGTKAAEPVTLKFYAHTVLDDFEKYINQFVKKKFPNVTLELVKNQKGSTIEELLQTGDIPDIIWGGLTNINMLTPLKVPIDLQPLAKKHGFDFNKYDTRMIDNIKSYSEQGQIYYMPYNVLAFALHYNKDIFDKFGVAYPKDNMNWDEVIELGKTLTRSENDASYVGLRPPYSLNRLQMQSELAFIDAKTEKSQLMSDGWKALFDLFKRINDVSNQPLKSPFGTRDEFLKARTTAMLPDILLLQNTDMVAAEKEGFRWDVVTFPTLKAKPNVNAGLFSDGFLLPQGSKHGDLAFQIIAFLSTDPEVQVEASKNGRLSALKDTTLLEHAFENNPAAKGKNLKPLFTQTYPVIPPVTVYDRDGVTSASNQLLNYVTGKSDINTALRQADEEFTKKIAELKAK
ncbi:carbohydrate ABC transporter substrate-binding protein [Paenibacillus hemerocallicola]|uniref:Carbohydrate ABC transporter substrate-binding protein n=1 Tax=Paenibacillus hemerocallicola TaxID=1172614 RepID=A0A5C4T2S1_9BACL|nr:ABC transporter substrate-binding protein [Paenibacillus hemerocallicola]TNJ63358.1 carbohydrate ABC transporter substrate-binding protein [Paenibacillus hemerocallicola]